MQRIKVGHKFIGPGAPVFLVGEVGLNHQGDLEMARKLIHLAAETGLDAVKFQKRDPSSLLTETALNQPYDSRFGQTYGEHRRNLELGAEVYARLKAEAEALGLIFFASVWDVPSADLLRDLDVGLLKIPSADLTNPILIEHVARFKRPTILSCGMGDFSEVRAAVDVFRRHHDRLILLQCTSAYPARLSDLNLRVITTLREEFGLNVGYSGHEEGCLVTPAVVALGASVIERHITLDRSLPGPDHRASLDPVELEQFVRLTRRIERALGRPEKRFLDVEQPSRLKLAKSLCTTQALEAGQVFTREALTAKSPGTGISPLNIDRIIGLAATRDLEADQIVLAEHVAWPRRKSAGSTE